eukprot:TRINITY_DN237_c3_g1_i1.p1 TRINITY_DN237_c3_g1~~TRINITY_DN237_c3_g1_i1.p1  ORF type:complete len:264 (-),score=47.43 TRINITY_DN237_c3_g1_i1:159-950(-)
MCIKERYQRKVRGSQFLNNNHLSSLFLPIHTNHTMASYDGDKNTYGKFNGFGKYTWEDGSSYEGLWRFGKLTGQGTYRWMDGSVYEGDFVDGKKNGKGTHVTKEGVYQGEFKDDKKSGKGFYWAVNGDRYWGDWFEGEYNGVGILYIISTGTFFDGNWEKGIFKSGIWCKRNNLYKGPFVNGQFHGRGTYVFDSGKISQANFRNGDIVKDSVVEINTFPAWAFPRDFLVSVPQSVSLGGLIPQSYKKLFDPIPYPDLPAGVHF